MAFGTTPSPVSLLNTAGSTAGQAIVSPGPAGPAGWGNVSAAALTGIAPVVNGGTGVTTAAAELSRIGAAPLAGASFTGPVTLSYSSAGIVLNDTSGSGFPGTTYKNNSVQNWSLHANSSGNGFSLDRWVSGSFVDSPISVANATGIVTMSDGVAGTPISGSTGSFTTLSATGLISPTSTVGIKGTATNDSAQAGSVGEYQTFSTAAAGATTGVTQNATQTTSPLAAGDWDIQCVALFIPAGTTVITNVSIGVNTVSATIGALGSAAAIATGAAAGFSQTTVSPVVRESLASATTVYCPANASFSTSTLTITGFMRVRRVR